MNQAIAAREVKLQELELKFGLEWTFDETFFSEWSEALPEITESDR